MGDGVLRTLAWAWLPALLVVLVAVGTVRWAEAPGGPLGGAGASRCSTSDLTAFLGCP
ncbi:hypothetical protein [Nocardioides perillae]|uniref:Uncharacterized protein n=1 Tax=Nocardioides perillae TaxID=1119534 RepID=A0A7Y9UJ48_9ACTN|nr:hypothetical protein [Nocardioides perillae]NYG53848.1 hypothetical protein [Nocardioides perillae]